MASKSQILAPFMLAIEHLGTARPDPNLSRDGPDVVGTIALTLTFWRLRWESNPRPDDYKRALVFRFALRLVPECLISAAR
jgi:hypothetical protein